jgi:hypothetical protein
VGVAVAVAVAVGVAVGDSVASAVGMAVSVAVAVAVSVGVASSVGVATSVGVGDTCAGDTTTRPRIVVGWTLQRKWYVPGSVNVTGPWRKVSDTAPPAKMPESPIGFAAAASGPQFENVLSVHSVTLCGSTWNGLLLHHSTLSPGAITRLH